MQERWLRLLKSVVRYTVRGGDTTWTVKNAPHSTIYISQDRTMKGLFFNPRLT